MDLPVSVICQRALEQAVQRMTAVRALAQSEQPADELIAHLPRFTDRARTALGLAVEDQSGDDQPAVGTGQLLAGLLAEGGNLALQVLRALELEPAQVGRELQRLPAGEAGPSAGPGARRFSGPAANALERSVGEAIALGHNFVGCEHLLLGLVAEPDGTAGRLLRRLGAEPRPTRRAVTAALAGYAHLRSQTAADETGGTRAVAAAVRQELQPVIGRVERLERHLGLPAGS
jgi:ATP-dependent Clp protease ATP-binding subunit ClpA